MSATVEILIEPVGGDLVAFAQCVALDASVFPRASLPPDATRAVFVARARRDGPVVGFAATHGRNDRLEIIGIAVDAAHRRCGCGSALIARVEHEAVARGMRELALHVAVNNTPAIRVYERAGFSTIRRLRNHYRTGDAYEMVKRVAR